MRNIFRFLVIAAVSVSSVVACGDKDDPVTNGNTDGPDTPTPVSTKPSKEIQQASNFALNTLYTYYLWNQEIYNDLEKLDPETCLDPKTVVHDIRYHANGKEVDHWTQLTDDMKAMTSSVEGLGLSYGYSLEAGRISNKEGVYFLIVDYVVKGGPADKGKLKRGDLIMTIDGSEITSSNINNVYNSEKITLGVAHLTADGYLGAVEYDVTLSAEDIWEDPVLVDTTYDVGGKTVGYLVYNSFDLNTLGTLPGIFCKFKEKGVQELILDLRYNGGGFVTTECELASLIAPYASVAAKDIFQTEVYNSILTEAWKESEDFNTYFDTKFEYKNENYDISEDISDANLDLKKIYCIVTSSSASASEGLIVGLTPYVDITLIGQQTYGKYCAGYMLSPKNVFSNSQNVDISKIGNWGIYVMVSKFADKYGNNRAMPDGIPVDIEVQDNALDGFQFGDENETMLRAALSAAGKVYTKAPIEGRRSGLETVRLEHGAPRGMLIKTDIPDIPLR